MNQEGNESVSPADESPQEDDVSVEVTTPIVVNMGKTTKKQIKKLKQGEGRLMDEVVEVMDEVVEVLGKDVDGKTLVPVVVVYEKKPPKRRRSRITLPF